MAIATAEDAISIADSASSTAEHINSTSASINVPVSKNTPDNISAKRKHTNAEPSKVSDSKKPKIESNRSEPKLTKKSTKLTCALCKRKSKNSFESRYHNEFHRSRRCIACNAEIDERSVEKHIHSCLLFSGKMSTKEMRDYMTPCMVRLKIRNKPENNVEVCSENRKAIKHELKKDDTKQTSLSEQHKSNRTLNTNKECSGKNFFIYSARMDTNLNFSCSNCSGTKQNGTTKDTKN